MIWVGDPPLELLYVARTRVNRVMLINLCTDTETTRTVRVGDSIWQLWNALVYFYGNPVVV